MFTEQKQTPVQRNDSEQKNESGMTLSGHQFLCFPPEFQLVHFLCSDFSAVIIPTPECNVGSLSDSTAVQLERTV